jgi:hypothetical protein
VMERKVNLQAYANCAFTTILVGLFAMSVLLNELNWRFFSFGLLGFSPFLISIFVTWAIHYQYVQNDKSFEIQFSEGYLVFLNYTKQTKIRFDEGTEIVYFRRQYFNGVRGYMWPFFHPYFYVKVSDKNNEFYISCLAIQPYMWFLKNKMTFQRKNVPFLPLSGNS